MHLDPNTPTLIFVAMVAKLKVMLVRVCNYTTGSVIEDGRGVNVRPRKKAARRKRPTVYKVLLTLGSR